MSAPTTTEDPCVRCGKSTAFGTGLFVNRVPGDHHDEETGEYRDGYWCVICLGENEDDEGEGDCDHCGTFVANGHGFYISDDLQRVCIDCYEDAGGADDDR